MDAWTTINEPLTAARFSALYGLWYPHRRSDAAFVRALLNQAQAIRLAMRRIRAERPGALLVQTEDLGRTSGTPSAASQVKFDNHRRWLNMDLLHGRVDRRHPLWRYLLRAGAGEKELCELSDDPHTPRRGGHQPPSCASVIVFQPLGVRRVSSATIPRS